MITYRIETRDIKIPDIIQCDVCKLEYDWEMNQDEFIKIDFVGGYNSTFGDGTKVLLDVCSHCLRDMFEKHMRIEELRQTLELKSFPILVEGEVRFVDPYTYEKGYLEDLEDEEE